MIKKLIDLIGNTPVVPFEGIFIKLEQFNPSGSVKDRAVLAMIQGMEQDGRLKIGDTIVEPTSGNTGIGIAMVGALLGYRVVITMPDTMSVERRKVIQAYGAEIVLTPGAKGMVGAIEKAKEYVKELGYVMLDQFNNPYNPTAHYQTAKEIIEDFDHLDYFVAGIGTGGTITGVGESIRRKFPNVRIIGVEPKESPILTEGIKGPHGIQGIGAGFIPTILNQNVIHEVRTVPTQDAYDTMVQLAKKGLFLGISSGAAIKVGYDLLQEHPGKTILVLSADGGLKYLSNLRE